MKKLEVEHVLRAASKLCDDHEFIIIGSQSLHGRFPDVADSILMSYEVDIFAKNRIDKTDNLNAIGNSSPFHELHGYYADPVDERTAVLPRKWRERLVHLKLDDPELKVKAYCLDPHDLVVAKLAAGREKDAVFIRQLLAKGLVDQVTIKTRLEKTTLDAGRRQRMEEMLRSVLARPARSADTLAAQWEAKSPTGSHSGMIKAISDDEVIQHVGRDRHVVWPAKALSGAVLTVDQFADIDSLGVVAEAKMHGPER